MIEEQLRDFSGPKWHSVEIVLGDAPKDKHIMYYRDVRECGDHLMGQPILRGKMTYAPVRLKEDDDQPDKYDEMCSGTAWNDQQVSIHGNH